MKSGGKRLYVPLDPQPSLNEVVTIVCYMLCLMANKDYQRRILWHVSGDDELVTLNLLIRKTAIDS